MFVNDAATIIGIRPTALRKFLRTHSIDTPRGSHARYEFTMEQVQTIREQYWAENGGTVVHRAEEPADAPGMPVHALTDPAQRQAFRELRRARNARLDVQMREARMTLPQMSNAYLAATGRIL